jgi:coniferyl-aldehyde dehydrogenase
MTMNATNLSSPALAIPAEFHSRFDAQRAALLEAPDPSYAERLADLKALSRLLKDNQAAIVKAPITAVAAKAQSAEIH